MGEKLRHVAGEQPGHEVPDMLSGMAQRDAERASLPNDYVAAEVLVKIERLRWTRPACASLGQPAPILASLTALASLASLRKPWPA